MAKLIISRSTINTVMASSVAQQNEIAGALGATDFQEVTIPASMAVKGFKNFSVSDDGGEVTVEINDKLIFALVVLSAKYNSLVAMVIKALMALGIADKLKSLTNDTFEVSSMIFEKEEEEQEAE